MRLWPDNWGEILLPQAPLAELVVRASVIYLLLLVLLRLVGRREVGRFGLSDILVLLLIASAVRTGITGGYRAVADALILGGLIIGWDWLLALLAFHVEWVHRLIYARPLLIVREGRIVRENARRELLTPEQIREELRAHGVRSVSDVREAYLEPSGRMTVFREGSRSPGERG